MIPKVQISFVGNLLIHAVLMWCRLVCHLPISSPNYRHKHYWY